MKVLLDDILERQGKNRNWLSQETGITYTNICNLCKGKTTSILFENIDKICSVLNCQISDIFSHEYIETNRLIAYQNKLNKFMSKKDDTE